MSVWFAPPDLDELNRIHEGTAVSALGIRITAVGEDSLSGTMPVDERTKQPWGLLHGGASVALAETLDDLVDWDLLNDGPVRIGVGAVEVESGNFRYFDSAKERLDARHIMASGALPPGLPPVEIDGKLWWDGGLVSNTPLSHVLDTQDAAMLVFQVDLFPSAAAKPRTMMDVVAREKEIRFSSRTRQVSDQLMKLRKEREVIRRVLAKLPDGMHNDPDVAELAEAAREEPVSLVQLIYRPNKWEGGARDFEFSARTMVARRGSRSVRSPRTSRLWPTARRPRRARSAASAPPRARTAICSRYSTHSKARKSAPPMALSAACGRRSITTTSRPPMTG